MVGDFLLGFLTCWVFAGLTVVYFCCDLPDLRRHHPAGVILGMLVLILCWPGWLAGAADE